MMNFSINTRMLSALFLVFVLTQPSLAAVDELTGRSINESASDLYNPATGEMRNHITLYQRGSDGTLRTDHGTIQIPAGVEIIDSRKFDKWYEPTVARLTLVFIKNKMIRVEISE